MYTSSWAQILLLLFNNFFIIFGNIASISGVSMIISNTNTSNFSPPPTPNPCKAMIDESNMCLWWVNQSLHNCERHSIHSICARTCCEYCGTHMAKCKAHVVPSELIAWKIFFKGTGGPHWADCKSSYLDPCGCDWVECHLYPNTNMYSITAIDMTINQLTGTLSHHFGNFTKLRRLVLPLSQLKGSIPKSLCKLTSLTTLDLSSNFFTGIIPPSIGMLKSLVTLQLSNNLLCGCLPESIAKLNNLKLLRLEGNHLGGFIGKQLSLYLLQRNQLLNGIWLTKPKLTSSNSFWCNDKSNEILELKRQYIVQSCTNFTYESISPTVNKKIPNISPSLWRNKLVKHDICSIGHCGVVFSINPPLPLGLFLDNHTGMISGIPKVVMKATYFTVIVRSNDGNATAQLSFAVHAEPTAIKDRRYSVFIWFLLLFAFGSLSYWLVTFNVQKRKDEMYKHKEKNKEVDYGKLLHWVVLYIRDGRKGRKIGFSFHTHSLHLYKLLRSTYWVVFFRTILVIHLGFAYFEYYFCARKDFTSLRLIAVIECFFVLLYLFDIYMYATIFDSLTNHLYAIFRSILVAVIFVDIFFALLDPSFYRFSRWARPILLVLTSRALRWTLMGIGSTLPNMLFVFFLMLLVTSIYALFGFIFFLDNQAPQFLDVKSGMWNLALVLLDGSYVVRVMDPYLRNPQEKQTAIFFFLIFVVINTFFLGKALVGFASKGYKDYNLKKVEEGKIQQQVAFKTAFELLPPIELLSSIEKKETTTTTTTTILNNFKIHTTFVGSEINTPSTPSTPSTTSTPSTPRTPRTLITTNYRISHKTWIDLSKLLRPELPENFHQWFFENTITNACRGINFKQFKELLDIMDIPKKLDKKKSRSHKKIVYRKNEALKKALELSITKYSVIFIYSQVISFLMILLYVTNVLWAAELWKSDGETNTILLYVEYILIGVFILEVLFETIAYGSKAWKNRTFYIGNVVCTVAAIIFRALGGFDGSYITRILLAISFCRIFKLIPLTNEATLKHTKDLETIHLKKETLQILKRSGETLFKVGMIYTCMLYMFAVWGVDMFGGPEQVVPGSTRLEETPWNQISMETNFLTFQNALTALFFVSTTSRWVYVMEAAEAVTTPQILASFYFISFRIISWMVFLPLFVGMLVQSIMSSWENEKSKKKKKKKTKKNCIHN